MQKFSALTSQRVTAPLLARSPTRTLAAKTPTAATLSAHSILRAATFRGTTSALYSRLKTAIARIFQHAHVQAVASKPMTTLAATLSPAVPPSVNSTVTAMANQTSQNAVKLNGISVAYNSPRLCAALARNVVTSVLAAAWNQLARQTATTLPAAAQSAQ